MVEELVRGEVRALAFGGITAVPRGSVDWRKAKGKVQAVVRQGTLWRREV